MYKLLNPESARSIAERERLHYGLSIFPDANGQECWLVGQPDELKKAGVVNVKPEVEKKEEVGG